MIDGKMTSYCRALSELLLSMEVCDSDGNGLSLDEGAGRAVDMIQAVGSRSAKVMLIGNGGSAAIVSHVQNDLCKAVGVRAMVFNEPPLLMALANDEGYVYAFERCVNLWAEPGDLLLAISSSGASENILRAVKASSAHGASCITLSGFAPDNPLRTLGDLNFYAASDLYGPVEMAHHVLTHFLTDCVVMARSSAVGIRA